MSAFELPSAAFRREREATWHELEELVAIAERRGVRALSAAELQRLPVLYRATLSSLSVARTISLDRNLLVYLESLAARAYLVVYGLRRDFRAVVQEFFTRRFPAEVRRLRWHLLVSVVVMALGFCLGFVLTTREPDRFHAFVPAEYTQGRGPTASTAELRKTLYDEHGGAAGVFVAFASTLFTHNAKIGMLCFALGFAAGAPVLFLLVVNGLILGAFGALFHARGLSPDFWGWLLPHGITELFAVALCGAAGLALGQAVLFPGRATRIENLARVGRDTAIVVAGAIGLLFVAGLLEGIFRQAVHAIEVRYAVAGLTVVLWVVYFGFAGRRRRA